MREYNIDRLSRYWHGINLPLAAYVYKHSSQSKARSFCQSLLEILENCAEKFGQLPGAKEMILPLATQAWDAHDPRFWEVLCTCFLTLTYDENEFRVISFGQPIGRGPKNSDICIESNAEIIHVDVEMWHAARFVNRTIGQAREIPTRRARRKIEEKFANLPDDEIGVAALICVAQGEDFKYLALNKMVSDFISFSMEDWPRCHGKVYWLAGESDELEHFWFKLLDNSREVRLKPEA